jgi:pSer/pThr/pTyr-binding forkhead associated (FHA) protein
MDLEATVRVGRPRLTSISVNGTPESFDLRLPVNRIGRKSENDLAFPEEKTISGRHCEIYQEGKDWFIKDQGSTNGVLVNGKKVESTALKEGDQIKLGNKIFTFTRMA